MALGACRQLVSRPGNTVRFDTLAIHRQPELFTQREYDLIIVGGGIYGVMLALESVFRGLRPLLLEQDDFGGATSFNSLRIVHGGLRYLQKLDLKRHFESVNERRWFLANFPDLVRPLPCLMPLYGQGVKRKSIFRAALLINDVLSINRNNGVVADRVLPGGRVVNKAETLSLFPGVNQDRLQGAAIWHDAAVPDSQRAVIESLRWAAHYGADALNYSRVVTLSTRANRVRGVVSEDRESGNESLFRAPVVINAAGPWSQDIAGRFGSHSADWFWPSLAWNVLTDKPALSDHALAITPARNGGPTYFLHPWKGRLFIGTGHSAWDGPLDDPAPSSEQIQEMIDDVSGSIPELELGTENIERVFAGLLPATGPSTGDISTKPSYVDHSQSGGPAGLISVCGVKFTTARRVAANTLDRVFGKSPATGGSKHPRPDADVPWQYAHADARDAVAGPTCIDGIRRIIAEESAMNLRDVVFRRTDLWEKPEIASVLAPRIADCFEWSDEKKDSELADLAMALAGPGAQESSLIAQR